ncbi:MAG: SsrA-binding protein SmpB [Candidatus Pacebacteria bacterium]|nr:SsrA-binding protein SmpB [Candidatus Paceibacterota bacterium]
MERIENRKVRRDYTILETIEAGIVLSGSEVKSIRAHKASLDGAYVDVSGTKAELLNMDIQPYQPKNMKETYDQKQPRTLLLSRTELAKLADIKKQKGLTVVPISVYNKGRYLKVSLAVVRGKKKEDKREKLAKQAVERDIGRSLKNR